MLGQPYEALSHYARGVENSTASFFLDSALSSFAALDLAQHKLPGLDWCRGLLQLAKAWRFDQPDPAGPRPTPGHAPLSAPVVIVTGSCRGETNALLHATILEAFRASTRGRSSPAEPSLASAAWSGTSRPRTEAPSAPSATPPPRCPRTSSSTLDTPSTAVPRATRSHHSNYFSTGPTCSPRVFRGPRSAFFASAAVRSLPRSARWPWPLACTWVWSSTAKARRSTAVWPSHRGPVIMV